MVRESPGRVRIAALLLAFVGLVFAAAQAPAAAQVLRPAQETPSAALGRHMRVLAAKPKDFYALIGAGKAALQLGDTQAAAGFFGRAEEAWPSSPLPQVGMGAALAHDGEAAAALRYFTRAAQLGGTTISFGTERGLAYDLLGRHGEAQADYRAALSGPDADEARRRLALSLAIVGKKDEAVALLGPLMARGDAGAARTRALVLALNGEAEGARRSLESAMPGMSGQIAPFLARLPALRSDQKAAAVHLGIFPDSGQAYASASPQYVPSYSPPPPTAARPQQSPAPSRRAYEVATASPSEDRLFSIEQLIKSPTLASPGQQVANVQPVTRQQAASAGTRPTQSAAGSEKQRIWLQLASGNNAEALPNEFRRLKSRHRDLLEGISGYVAEEGDRARLLIGPFRNSSEAKIFAEDLASVDVDAFSWTSRPGQAIRKLPSE